MHKIKCGIVTGLISTRNKSRINIYIDNKYAFTIDKVLLSRFNIHVGLQISTNFKRQLLSFDLEQTLYRISLGKLSRRMHSENEILKYLRQFLIKLKNFKNEFSAEYKAEIIQHVLNRLKDEGYLNDLAFSKSIIDYKKNKKSRHEIEQILRQKGVDSDLIESVSRDMGKDESILIKNLAEKKLNFLGLKKLDKSTLKKKTMQFLVRKGFGFEDVYKIVNELIS